MTRNFNGDVRLALYERVAVGLIAFFSVCATGLSSWAMLTLVSHGERLAAIESRLNYGSGFTPSGMPR